MDDVEPSTINIEFIYTDTCPDCPPARRVLERVADEYDDIDVEYLLAEENPDKLHEHDVTHVPTIVVDGEVSFVESLTESKLKDKIDEKRKE